MIFYFKNISASQFYKDGVFGGKGPHIAGGRFGLGHGGIKSKFGHGGIKVSFSVWAMEEFKVSLTMEEL